MKGKKEEKLGGFIDFFKKKFPLAGYTLKSPQIWPKYIVLFPDLKPYIYT